MMIGKPEWFTYRIFGWGLRPKTKEGWIYIGCFILLLGLMTAAQQYFNLPERIFVPAILTVVAIIVADTIHIMTKLGKTHDERENQQQLIIERNVSYTAIGAIVIIILYQTIQYGYDFSQGLQINTTIPFDWEFAAILGAMVLAKVISTIYVSKKM